VGARARKLKVSNRRESLESYLIIDAGSNQRLEDYPLTAKDAKDAKEQNQERKASEQGGRESPPSP